MKSRSFQTKAKRVLAGILAVIMLVTTIPPMTAVAAVGTTKYSYNGYDVEYTVTGEWSTGQNVEVKVTNTGDESILNWAFCFDAGSEIVNIWNASIVESQGTEYVVKNNGWNYEILPQQSISFGYTLAEGNIPVSMAFELFSKRVDVTSGYEAKFNIINVWGNGAQAEIIISNTSDNVLEAWEFAFDCNFTIEGYWGARKVETDRDYGFASEAWSNPIPAGGSVSIVFTAAIDGEMKIDNFSMTEVEIEKLENNLEDETEGEQIPTNPDVIPEEDCDNKINIKLVTSEIEFLADNTYKTIYFYASVDSTVSSVSLIDNETNALIAKLYDDGNYTVSGDDIMGDGIYSAKQEIYLDNSKDSRFSYRAEIDEENISNIVEVNSYAPFTEEEIANMEYVWARIEAVFQRTEIPEDLLIVEFKDMTNSSEYASFLEKRCIAMSEELESLKRAGHLFSYYYDEEEQHFVCEYPNGITFITDVSIYQKAEKGEIQYSKITGDATGYSVVILNAFEDTESRTSFYEKLSSDLKYRGANVNYDDNVTVYDLMNKLEGKDIICLCGHGEAVYGKPWFLLSDDLVTAASLNYYVLEIKTGRIISLSRQDKLHYAVSSDFFEYHYGGNSLSGSFIFSESCEFMGNGATGVTTEFADAFIDSGAEAVVGFYNSVSAEYSREFMVFYIDELLNGKNASHAFNNACEMFGKNDSNYREATFFTRRQFRI